VKTYMDGWNYATRMIVAGFNVREVTGYAQFMVRLKPYDAPTQGFLAAVHAAVGG
jgi:hypothetical protein